MTQNIGLIINNAVQIFQRDVIAGVEIIAKAHGYRVVVDAVAEDPQHPKPVSFRIDDMAGILVIANVLSDEDLQALYDTGKPITLVSHIVDAIPIPAVIQNNMDGIRQLVDFLILECGRRDIAFIQGNLDQYDGRQRTEVFLQSMMLHDLIVPESHILIGDFKPEVAQTSLQSFIEAGYSMDAIIAADFQMAIATLDVLFEAGLKVPEDVCVVGFGDSSPAEAAGLTTVGADVVGMGKRAVRQLLAQIDGYRFTGVTWLNSELIERDTCQRILIEG